MRLPRLRVALLFLALPVTVDGEAFALEHNLPGEFDYSALVLAHGICSGPDPAQYFGVARELYERVKVPEPVGFRLNKIALSRRDRNRVRVLRIPG